MGLIYLDTCVVVYALEHNGAIGARARSALLEHGGARFAVSPLVVHEALVVPLRKKDDALLERYEKWFGLHVMLTLGMREYVAAAQLRAANPAMRAPDALHLATARLAACDALWTNDTRLAAASGGFAVDIISHRPDHSRRAD